MCECETPEAFTETVRKARKPHKCCECSHVIRPGECYRHVWGVWDKEPSSFATCLPCAELHRWLEAGMSVHDDDACIAFRGLFEALDEHVRGWNGGASFWTSDPPEILGHALGLLMHYRLAEDDRVYAYGLRNYKKALKTALGSEPPASSGAP